MSTQDSFLTSLLRPRWNLHPQAVSRHRSADAFVVSIPKSGRTWVRVFVQAYSCALDGQPFSLAVDGFRTTGIPRVVFTHDLFSNVTDSRRLRRLAGVHLIPRSVRYARPIVLLCRDPRDVVVSLYFHLTKRKQGVVQPFVGSLSEMLRDRVVGFERIVSIMNGWLGEWVDGGSMMLLRYEECRTDTAGKFSELLHFVGHEKIDEASFKHALEFASFDNMRALEQKTATNDTRPALRPGVSGDPDSFKVRRGVVGGYTAYLSPEDLDFVNEAMKSLDHRFGYRSS